MNASISTDTDVSSIVRSLRLPGEHSHKGQNGRLLIIGGSHLFHSASLWALQVASRIVDLVHFSSVSENNAIVAKLKEEFRDGIVVPRAHIEDYIDEDDVILIGPGMLRADAEKIAHCALHIASLNDIETIEDEGVQTYALTKYLLQKYPKKRWVIDAGALQMMEPAWIPKGAILTPHHKEFEKLYVKSQKSKVKSTGQKLKLDEQVQAVARKYQCIVLLKGEVDIVASAENVVAVSGGNAGMTKGGTGDVLAGLVAALACSNDPFVAAVAGSHINKQAGDDLFATQGYWFNASDLASQIPKTMKRLML